MSTIYDLIKDIKLEKKSILERCIMYAINVSKEQMWIDIDRKLTEEEEQKIKLYYHQYVIEKKPLEYILGHVDFFGVPFFVDENTLIPRPETEYMIQAVDEYVQGKAEKDAILIDLGTGCGVLGISVLLHNPEMFKEIYFTDISSGALHIAEKNYADKIKNQNNHEFIEADLLNFIPDKKLVLEGKIMVIVANLPYIPDAMFDENVGDNVKNWEPKMAFVGSDDGLLYYRKMFDQYREHKKNGSIKIQEVAMFLEMMTWQVDILRKEYDEFFTFEEVKTFHFNIRIVKLQEK